MFKKISILGIFALFVLLLAAAPASAHNGGIYPADNLTDAMKGDFNDYLISQNTTKNLIVIHGHGFEYDFGNITTPLDITVVDPDGVKTVLRTQSVTEQIDKIHLGTKEPLVYQKTSFNFTKSGTYFVYTTLPADANTTEYLKTAIYVGTGTWSDWNRNLGLPLEFTMYTRMGSIAAGDTVHGRLNYGNGTGASDIKYYVEPVKTAAEAKAMYDMLVSDFPTGEDIYLIYSQRSSTDGSGDLVTSVPEKGVWSLVGAVPDPSKENGTIKATYIFPALPQIYGDAGTSAPAPEKETPGFGVILGLLAVVGAVLIIRRK
jgi:Nickel uptake substrate-specific transmembrane region.